MRTILLGDIGNRLDIEDTENEISTLRARAQNARNEVAANERKIELLTRELGQQKLAIQALTRFLISKGLVDEKELNVFTQEIDAEDGVIDGQMALDEKSGRLRFVKKQVEFDGKFQRVEWS